MAQPIVTSSSDILSGTPVFAGTRVPVQALIDYLEGSETIDDFLAGFPTVRQEVDRRLASDIHGSPQTHGA
ncbi:MAG: DUF433 domain-containing protein [Candidatus Rokubacteria bacterium]|nr:DUF433 domain-containing protein [Candidatus Rokubacteria bacterium]